MPVAPDVDYFLMGSEQLAHIGCDTGYFFRYVAEDANEFIDAYERTARPRYRHRRHMDKLRDMGRYCEEHFVRWRAGNPAMRRAPSRMVCDSFSGQIEELCEEWSLGLINHGHTRLTPLARRALERHDFSDGLAVLKRTCRRAHADLDGYTPEAMDAGLVLCNELFSRFRNEVHEAIEACETPPEDREIAANLNRSLARGGDPRSKRLETIRQRKVAKRSIRLAERFIGAENVRMFISGDHIRVRGQLATYQITKQRHLMASHGGAKLSVYTLDGETRLCDLCIYTAKVPLLDHVLSLILHIRSGEEAEILRIGNAFNLGETAYQHEWLVPFLPINRPRSANAGQIRTAMNLPPVYRGLDRRGRINSMRREIAEVMFDHLGEYCPPMPQTRAYLASGMDRAQFLREIGNEEFFGEVPEIALLPAVMEQNLVGQRERKVVYL